MAKGGSDGVSNGACGLATTIGAEAVPVEGMVPDLRGVVEYAALGGFDHFFQALAREVGTFGQAVQFGHIGFVVFAVVKLQGFS